MAWKNYSHAHYDSPDILCAPRFFWCPFPRDYELLFTIVTPSVTEATLYHDSLTEFRNNLFFPPKDSWAYYGPIVAR